MQWICTIDFEKEHISAFGKRYKDTGDWFLREPKFKQWFDDTNSCILWCHGKRKYPKLILLH